jgi:2-dehydropantoate 2-reductase
VCIIGAGALGLGLAAHFSKAAKVYVVGRSNKAEQLRHCSESLGLNYVASTSALPFELSSLWLCVKAYDNLDALRSVEQLFSPSVPIVLLSNGLGVYQECAELIGRRAPIVRGLINTGFLETIDSIVQIGVLKTALASSPDHANFADDCESFLKSVGAEVAREPNVALTEWKKALINCTINPICSLVRSTNKVIAENPQLRALSEQVLAEVRATALAEGFDLSSLTNEQIFQGALAHGENRNSMLVDLERGRRTELDYILGRVVRIADNYGVPIPHARSLYQLCKALETLKSGAALKSYPQ